MYSVMISNVCYGNITFSEITLQAKIGMNHTFFMKYDNKIKYQYVKDYILMLNKNLLYINV